MAYLRFLESGVTIPCRVIPEGKTIVTLKFETSQTEPNLNGFDLFLDKKAEIDIGGNTYHGFTTLYRNDEVTAAYNGYQLSNDGSVYTEPTIPEASVPELSDEEKAELELQNQIMEKESQIRGLKESLSSTDYIIIKMYEYSLAGKTCSDYDIEAEHAERQALRDEINSLEQELALLKGNNTE